MKNRAKTIVALFVIAILFQLSAMSAQAQIMPRWSNTESVDCGLSFSGTTAYCDASVLGKTGTTKITGTVWLERINSSGNTTVLKAWGNLSSNNRILDFYDTYTVTKGYTYKLNFSGTVYKGGVGESVSASIDADCK